MARSKSALVAPMPMGMATSWIISAAPGPNMWQPSTLPPSFSVMSFKIMRSLRAESVFIIGRKRAR